MVKFALYANTTGTAEDAPFTGRIIPNGVVNKNDLITAITERIASGSSRVAAHIEEAVNVAIEKGKLGWSTDLGFLVLKPRMSGSATCVDSPFDATSQALVFDAYLGTELRGCLDAIVPTKVDSASLAASMRVSNVEDLTTHLVNVITGTNQFVITGNDITVDSEGEYVKLLNYKTEQVVMQATVQSVSKGQRAYCVLPSSPDSGKYYIEVATKGLVGLDNPIKFTKPVEVIHIDPPTAPSMTEVFCENNPSATNHIQCFQAINDLVGTGLDQVTAVKFKWESTGGTQMEETGTIVSKTSELLKFKMPEVQFGECDAHLAVVWSGGEVTSSFVVVADEPS